MYKGAEQLLDALQQKRIPFALIRNTTLPPAEFQKVVDEVHANKYFHIDRNIVLSGDTGT
jgi:hypothetical protein